MKALARTRKIGGSVVVTIPKVIVEEEQIQPGELISIDVEKPRKSYFGALKGIGPFKKEDTWDVHE